MLALKQVMLHVNSPGWIACIMICFNANFLGSFSCIENLSEKHQFFVKLKVKFLKSLMAAARNMMNVGTRKYHKNV